MELQRTPQYEAKKASLSAEKRLLLDLAEEAIAADPDLRAFREDLGDVTIDLTDQNLMVAFRRFDRYHGELVAFTFLDEER